MTSVFFVVSSKQSQAGCLRTPLAFIRLYLSLLQTISEMHLDKVHPRNYWIGVETRLLLFFLVLLVLCCVVDDLDLLNDFLEVALQFLHLAVELLDERVAALG